MRARWAAAGGARRGGPPGAEAGDASPSEPRIDRSGLGSRLAATTTTNNTTNVTTTKEDEDCAARMGGHPTPAGGSRRRTWGAALASWAWAAPVLLHAGDAAAAGWYNDVGPGAGAGFVGGGGGSAGDMGGGMDYEYTTKDLAVDLASPLVAYKVVSWALNQEVPAWLDAVILVFVLAAVYVCAFDVTALDDVLV